MVVLSPSVPMPEVGDNARSDGAMADVSIVKVNVTGTSVSPEASVFYVSQYVSAG